MGEESNHECDYCGEGFRTLSRLRLHDCRPRDIGEALIPDPESGDIPDDALAAETLEAITLHDAVDQFKQLMTLDVATEKDVISFVISIDGSVYGFHSDHDTGEWHLTASGEDFETVEHEHREWVADDIERVTGDSMSAENIDIEVPSTITRECGFCGNTHELHPDFDPELATLGVLEYNGYCDETDQLLVETNPEEIADETNPEEIADAA